MKWFCIMSLLVGGTLAISAIGAGKAAVEYIDPLIGTEGAGSQYGGMWPGVGQPFASLQWVGMTRLTEVGRTSYNFSDTNLLGFTIFYTGFYHALLYPRIFSEYGRYYSAFDDQIHDGVSYTSYSLWDTYRAEHALLTLVASERVDGMMEQFSK